MSKYLVHYNFTRVYTPEKETDLGFNKEFVDEIPANEDGFSFELAEYAIKHFVWKSDFTKRTACIRIDADYYDPEEDPELRHPVAELHGYVQRNDDGQLEAC